MLTKTSVSKNSGRTDPPRRTLAEFADRIRSARRAIDAGFDELIAAAEEFANFGPSETVMASGPDRTGGYELAEEITGYDKRTIQALISRGINLPHFEMPSGRGHRPNTRFSEVRLREWMRSLEVKLEA
jgi:hypothetical protein